MRRESALFALALALAALASVAAVEEFYFPFEEFFSRDNSCTKQRGLHFYDATGLAQHHGLEGPLPSASHNGTCFRRSIPLKPGPENYTYEHYLVYCITEAIPLLSFPGGFGIAAMDDPLDAECAGTASSSPHFFPYLVNTFLEPGSTSFVEPGVNKFNKFSRDGDGCSTCFLKTPACVMNDKFDQDRRYLQCTTSVEGLKEFAQEKGLLFSQRSGAYSPGGSFMAAVFAAALAILATAL